MKKLGKVKKAEAVLITVVLAAMLALQTAAAVLADGEKPSLTIQASSEGNHIPGVEWSVYQVAKMPQDGEFVLTEPFKTSGLDIKSLNDSKQSEMQKSAKRLSDFAADNRIEATALKTTDSLGMAKIEGLDRGLYLICQTGTPGTDLIVESIPFFVALPMMESVEGKKVMRYEVTAYPKMETEDPPATEPETGESKPEESTSGESKPEESTSGESGPEESTSGESKPEESTPGESKPEESTPGESGPDGSTSAETSASAGTNGGGSHSNRDHGGGNSERTIINDPEIPLASFPTSPETPGLEILEDNPVPLAALPRLGDMGTGGALAGLLLSLAAASAALAAYKKFGKSE